MRKAILGWDNYADTAAYTPSSEVTSLPAENLATPQVTKPWRTATAGAPWLRVDIQGSRNVGVIAFMRVNLTPAGKIRVRASNSDPDVLTGLVYDSGLVDANVDARFGMAIHLLPEGGKNAQYWRIDLSDTGLDYYEAGRLFIGPAWSPSVNYSYGWRQGYTDLSKRSRSRGGQTYVDSNRTYRYFAVTFDYLTKEEAEEALLEMDRIIGLRGDVLAVLDPDDTNSPGRSSIWGQLQELSAVVNPQFEVYQKSIQIEERI